MTTARLTRASGPTPVRILIVNPWGVGIGYSGPGTLFRRLFSQVAAEGTATVAGVCRSRFGEPAPDWLSPAVLVRQKRPEFDRYEQVRFIGRAVQHILRHRRDYDLVHCHGAYATTIAVASLLRLLKVRYVILPVLEKGDLGGPSRRHGWGVVVRRSRTYAVGGAVRAFALTPEIGRELVACGLVPARVTPIGNPVGAEFFAPAALPSADGAVELIFVGKLGPTKRPDLVLQAVRLLLDAGLQARASFIGPASSSAYLDYFTTRVHALGLREYIEHVGFTDDVAPLLRRAGAVFVLPSEQEGLPGALAEAMASGLPSVVSDAGAMPQVMTASGGGVVVARTPEAMAAAVLRLASDPDLYAQTSQNAARYARTAFSEQVVARTYLSGVVPARPKQEAR